MPRATYVPSIARIYTEDKIHTPIGAHTNPYRYSCMCVCVRVLLGRRNPRRGACTQVSPPDPPRLHTSTYVISDTDYGYIIGARPCVHTRVIHAYAINIWPRRAATTTALRSAPRHAARRYTRAVCSRICTACVYACA